MDWLLDFMLWENRNGYSIVHPTLSQRIARAQRAVVSRHISRGCCILTVNFDGKIAPLALPSPAEINTVV